MAAGISASMFYLIYKDYPASQDPLMLANVYQGSLISFNTGNNFHSISYYDYIEMLN